MAPWPKTARLLLSLIALSSIGAGCESNLGPQFVCDRRVPGGGPTAGATGGGSEPIGQTSEALTARIEALWTITEIPVCWDAEAWASVSETDRKLVQRAVAESWESALADVDLPTAQLVHFTGWQSCDQDAAAATGGIRITTTTDDPMTLGLGKELAGMPGGMLLNFTFRTWSTKCSETEPGRQHCIYAVAVHEFGHALGLAHEQNRTDTPRTCHQPAQGESGDIYLGQWDQQSVMNYCNPVWDGAGILSETDESGIRTLYYPGLASDYCRRQASPRPSASP